MKRAIILTAIALLTLVTVSSAIAGGWRHRSHAHGGHGHVSSRSWSGGHSTSWGGGYSTRLYHAPSVHYDRTYHADSLHWTPFSGLHTDGHYDVVPHVQSGHVDSYHRGQVDVNPWFHH